MTGSTYVFVPGAGGQAAYWDLVRARLSAQGVGSIAVSLPGEDPEAGCLSTSS